jgi:molybdate transport system substrate-binding protein
MSPLTGITSMATRALAAELAEDFARRSGQAVQMQAAGGVDVAKRLRAGERFDLVLLAEDALRALAAEGIVQAASLRPFADSDVVVAVPAGAARPDISTAAALREAVLATGRIGYSTGPSGQTLLQRFEAWGLLDRLRPRLVQAPAGVPVARLLAEGQVDLGFQQRSELVGAPGIDILGALPSEVAILTRFSAALAASAAPGATALLEALTAAEAAACKQRHGMAAPD